MAQSDETDGTRGLSVAGSAAERLSGDASVEVAPMRSARTRRGSGRAGATSRFWTTLGIGAALAVGCGGATQFEDKAPLVFNAPEPEPEPEPEPPQVAALAAQTAPELGQTLQFAFDSAELIDNAISTLREVTDILRQNPELSSVQVEGHASEEGTEQYNQRLSEARARAVRAFLIAQGISSERLRTLGFGELRPVADNGTEAGRRQNRRVEFNILSSEGS